VGRDDDLGPLVAKRSSTGTLPSSVVGTSSVLIGRFGSCGALEVNHRERPVGELGGVGVAEASVERDDLGSRGHDVEHGTGEPDASRVLVRARHERARDAGPAVRRPHVQPLHLDRVGQPSDGAQTHAPDDLIHDACHEQHTRVRVRALWSFALMAQWLGQLRDGVRHRLSVLALCRGHVLEEQLDGARAQWVVQRGDDAYRCGHEPTIASDERDGCDACDRTNHRTIGDGATSRMSL